MGGKENLVERAKALTADMIFKYQLPPGSRISDFTLARKLGISRTPIREAIMQLAALGIVSKTDDGFKIVDIDEEMIDDLYNARLCLETAILEFSMHGGINARDVTKLRTVVESERKAIEADQIPEALHLDMEFHRGLVSLCHNKRLEEAFFHLYMQMKMLNVLSLANPNLNAPYEYLQICDSIERADAGKASELLVQCIEKGRIQKKEVLRKFGEYGMKGLYRFIAGSISTRAGSGDGGLFA